MKLNRHKKLIVFSSLLLVLGVVGGWWWMTQPDQASRFYPANLASRGYFAIETDKGVVTLGNKKTTHKFESQIHIAPDANSSMTIQYDLGQDVEPVVENDLVKWKTDSQELFFKQIPKGESSAATVPHARDNGVLRYAPLGRTSLAEFVASYELFSSRQSSTPTVTTFVPS